MRRSRIPLLVALALLLLCAPLDATAAAERVVVIKADGLPFEVVDRLVREKDPYTGKSLLPWIDYVFYRNGTRLSNFYSRGLSLSAPSWAILDTGQHSLIKGNLEFDRLTLDSYDYLNIFSFVLKNSAGRTTDTPAARLLDEYEVSVLSDIYSPSEHYRSVQIIARGLKSVSLIGSLKRLLTLQNPKEWVDEWTIGLDAETVLFEVLERELITKLRNPQIRYLDFLVPFFDHAAHTSREPEAQLHAVQKIDAVLKRVWTAIQETPLASKTALILVSDHGMNTDPEVYSQGFNLVEFFGSVAGGGHHILTNRPPQGEYSFKALSPAVPMVVTASSASPYLKGQSADYPTLALDADGNERASVYVRQYDLNVLQILWQQLLRQDLTPRVRSAAVEAFLATVDRNRAAWSRLVSGLQQEQAAIARSNISPGLRKADELRYSVYIQALRNLLVFDPETIGTSRYKVENLIPKRSFGLTNSIHDLQNYVIAPAAGGLVLREDGSLDMDKSFARINYFSLLGDIRARNNVQPSISSQPIDFVALSIAPELLHAALPDDVGPVHTAVWLFRDKERQGLILGRQKSDAESELRYLPAREVTQSKDGQVHFSMLEWSENLPLKVWEGLPLPVEQRSAWLNAWHAESEWLQIFHASQYSNAVVSLHEQFAMPPFLETSSASKLNPDEQLIARFRERRRNLAMPDFIIFANDHWNFNFRGFNPGGNHGAFFRASTHATLMFAGGNDTNIPQGLVIDQPYDALSFVPTVLRLAGKNGNLERRLPGPVIHEMFIPTIEQPTRQSSGSMVPKLMDEPSQ